MDRSTLAWTPRGQAGDQAPPQPRPSPSPAPARASRWSTRWQAGAAGLVAPDRSVASEAAMPAGRPRVDDRMGQCRPLRQQQRQQHPAEQAARGLATARADHRWAAAASGTGPSGYRRTAAGHSAVRRMMLPAGRRPPLATERSAGPLHPFGRRSTRATAPRRFPGQRQWPVAAPGSTHGVGRLRSSARRSLLGLDGRSWKSGPLRQRRGPLKRT